MSHVTDRHILTIVVALAQQKNKQPNQEILRHRPHRVLCTQTRPWGSLDGGVLYPSHRALRTNVQAPALIECVRFFPLTPDLPGRNKTIIFSTRPCPESHKGPSMGTKVLEHRCQGSDPRDSPPGIKVLWFNMCVSFPSHRVLSTQTQAPGVEFTACVSFPLHQLSQRETASARI